MTTITLRRAPGTATAWNRLWPGNMLARLRATLERQRARQALARMDDRLLADVGLTRDQALREAAKPFWMD